MASWRPTNSTSVHCIDWVDRSLSKLSFQHPDSFPDLSGSTLYLFSDYAGTAKDRYLVYSFLLTSETNLIAFDQLISAWRSSRGLDQRRFEYKKLNDAKKLGNFSRFLGQLDQVPGLLLTIAIDTKIESLLCGESFDRSKYQSCLPIHDGLSDAVIEKLFRCASFASILVNGLCTGGQKLVWVSDDDDMFANDRIAVGGGSLIEVIFNYLTTCAMGMLDYAVASKFQTHAGCKDLLSACDLACGYFVSHFREAMGPIVPPARRKDFILSGWLAGHGKPLRRVCFTIDRRPHGGPSLSRSVLIDPFRSKVAALSIATGARPF